ncbi:MAG: type III-B CRISPR module RAMP protein Cmr4 [Bacteroidota bacterium]
MKTHTYILRNLSNLHVRQGDSDMDVIDKKVQRDPTTSFPTIRSSGVKGALREYFDHKDSSDIDRLFGTGTQGNERGEKLKYATGALFFGQGYLLSLPLRSDLFPYFHVTTPGLIKAFLDQLTLREEPLAAEWKLLLSPLAKMDNATLSRPAVFRSGQDGAILEEESFKAAYTSMQAHGISEDAQPAWRKKVEGLLGGPFAVMRNEDFAEFSRDLPIIARNRLNHGVSENLWYEEIVPREARFFLLMKGPEKDLADFEKVVHEHVIQLGANATIGYGQTLFTRLSTPKA